MSVDQYSVCPCGSGKKIKFCKCKESIHEMERVLKMMTGGQMVAALDRLNQVLTEHPDAAWCLALKGRLLLDLNEHDALRENSERFIRLQPSNPLALTQQAAYFGIRNEVQKSAESLLQALAESSGGVDSFLLDVASVLSLSLAQTGSYLSARCFAGLAMSAEGYSKNELASMTIQEINRSEDISALLKDLPSLASAPKDPSVNERYNEALVLLRANQIQLAATKFDSLARSLSQEEAILRGQLVCAVWQADLERQVDLMRKLSELESLSQDERAYWLASSLVLEPGQPNVSASCSTYEWNVEDIELLEQELLAHPRAVRITQDLLQRIPDDEDSQRPRSMFHLTDRDCNDIDTLPEPQDAPVIISTVALYGKQTDRPARCVAASVCAYEHDSVLEMLNGFQGLSSEPFVAEGTLPLLGALSTGFPLVQIRASFAELNELQQKLEFRDCVARLMATRLKVLGDRTPSETLDDSSLDLQRAAIILVLDSIEDIHIDDTAIPRLREALKVAEPELLKPKSPQDVFDWKLIDLNRVDIPSLSFDESMLLLQRAHVFRYRTFMKKIAKHALEIEHENKPEAAVAAAYTCLIESADSSEEVTAVVNEARQRCKENNTNYSSMLLNGAVRFLNLRDPNGFQMLIGETIETYRQDQHVMTTVQQLLIQLGIMNPDGSLAAMAPQANMATGGRLAPQPSPAPPAASGLWTPDSPQASQPAGGGSKLWVPGQD